MKIKITDNSNYDPSTCHDGGGYSFTTIYHEVNGGRFEVEYSTSADFSYCPFCGSFYEGSTECICGETEPRIIDAEEVLRALASAIKYGDEIEIS